MLIGMLGTTWLQALQLGLLTYSVIMQTLSRVWFPLRRWDAEVPGITWQRLMENKNKELDRLNGVYRMLLDGAGVEYIEGRGKLVDAHTVEVGGKKYTVHIACSPSCWIMYLEWLPNMQDVSLGALSFFTALWSYSHWKYPYSFASSGRQAGGTWPHICQW